MSRLIAFGCSFTYGHGLSDCKETDTGWTGPSKFAWPSMLANKLNYKLDNQSYPGSSNLEILYKILSFKFEPGDLVVIMWTLPLRDTQFDESGVPTIRLGPWAKAWVAKQWMKIASETDYTQRSWLYIHHADLYLKNKNIQYFHCPAYSYDNRPEYLNIEHVYLKTLVKADKAEDGAHPGLDSHRQTAEKIFGFINE